MNYILESSQGNEFLNILTMENGKYVMYNKLFNLI